MRIASTITRVLMWVALVVYSVMQFLAAYGIVVENNLRAVEQEMPDKVYKVVPRVVITLLMILAVILFTVWKKRPYIGLALSAVAGIALLVTTLSMSRAFPLTTNAYGEYGLSLQKLVLCHYSFLIVPVLMLMTWGFRRIEERRSLVRQSAREGRKWKEAGGSRLNASSPRILSDPELNEATRKRKKWAKSKK